VLASPVRTLLVALLLVVVPVAAVGAAGVDAARQEAQAAKLDETDLAVERAAKRVEGILSRLEKGLLGHAATPAIREAISARSPASVAAALDAADTLLPEEVLRIFALDRQGVLLGIAPRADEFIGQSFAFRDYYIGVARDWRPYVSDTFVAQVQGTPPTVAITVPVMDSAGAAIGVLGVTIDLEVAGRAWFGRLQASFDDVYLVDGKGLVITRAAAPGADTRRDVSTDPSVRATARGERVRGPVEDFAGAGPMLIASAPVGTSGWQLFVMDTPAELDRAVAPLRDLLAAVSGVLILLLLAAAVAVSLAVRGIVGQRQRLATLNSELERTSRAKSEFLANMSHELRTPMNAILGFSQLLDEQLRESISERQRRYLQNIHDAGSHLLALINDVLDIAKVEAGKIELRPEPVTVHEVVGPVISAARERGAGGGLRPGTPDPLQPGLERGEVHAERRPGVAPRLDRCPRSAGRGRRQRHRHPPGAAGRGVRGLHAAERGPLRLAGDRPGARAHPAPRGDPQRQDLVPERRGQRHDLQRRAAGPGGRPGGRQADPAGRG